MLCLSREQRLNELEDRVFKLENVIRSMMPIVNMDIILRDIGHEVSRTDKEQIRLKDRLFKIERCVIDIGNFVVELKKYLRV